MMLVEILKDESVLLCHERNLTWNWEVYIFEEESIAVNFANKRTISNVPNVRSRW